MFVFFFKQKTAYEMRISDWSSDVCSSDLQSFEGHATGTADGFVQRAGFYQGDGQGLDCLGQPRRVSETIGGRLLAQQRCLDPIDPQLDRNSTRLNSSH